MIDTEAAFAKLNLSLDIIGKRDDGYHDLRTVMQSISLSDEITVECTPGEGISVASNLPYLPADESNIAAKAALAYYGYTRIKGYHTRISIIKSIPVSAGLGGGSADGACVLRILDRMFRTDLGYKDLESIAETIGSDVPFCVAGGTALAEGRGELLTQLNPIPKSYVLVCKPSFTCSTPELFSLVRLERIRARPDTDGMAAAMKKGDLAGIAQRLHNVFEEILPRGQQEVADIKRAMHDYGAIGAAMTGSGPSVFGLFENESLAMDAYAFLKPKYLDCFIAETTGRLGC